MYIYILRCAKDTLYTGIAKDATERIFQHLSHTKQAAAYTKSHPPYALAALWQVTSRSDALKVEAAIKKLTRAKKDTLVANPESIDTIIHNMDIVVLSASKCSDIWEQAYIRTCKKLSFTV